MCYILDILYFEGVNNSLQYPHIRELRGGLPGGVEAVLSEKVPEDLSEDLSEDLPVDLRPQGVLAHESISHSV